MNLQAAFNPQDWSVLSGPLRLKPMAQRDRQRSLSARALLDDDTCITLLDQLGPVIGSPTRAITASLLAKRFSFLATGACLYAMSVCDQGLLLSLDDCVIEYGHDDGLWTSSMPLADRPPQAYAAGERDAWRAAIVEALFAGLLAPLWQTFNRVSGISRRILWENTAVRVYSLYEKRMGKVEDPLIRLRHEADFDWLLQEAAPALFGLDYNPLRHFRRPPTQLEEGKSIRFRRTCCFYYEATEPAEYCSTCPLLRPRKCR
ncbi:IucA/IucC family C-terminal-domain containing protein [Pseudomonas chlororaphis]|uniref:IucA/IucC family C-terminal-domain containing protein n=1 Tax=Pseudomonas chlororaphis TaxID=587753 RepID=UPI0006A58B03|nr:IucA/IucC family C-terminal-domain containing protein [Pseudomonas chlororaphis]AZD02521.1 putative Fe-S protein in siderophore biosynthesis operon [Pseudomonas chlororaphis subsp. chlororaphis]MBM0280568.1 (2Fe-2S)-binding protein [Pseudomonas chlororaphis]MDO1504792.1 siderophore-iron reductase, Fe-S cluster protein [Pseudomonas chlororaphis]ORM44456.1 siderophore-iron reductase, Fe-S cluster protein [Pseudomonas chlororaphis subsp. chlororaphis]TWR95921.1 siderophore-iron reductase, Fe-S